MKTYERKFTEDGDPVECESCGLPAPVADYSSVSAGSLCEFCASTLASRHIRHARGDQFTALRAEIWKAAAAVANYLKHGV